MLASNFKYIKKWLLTENAYTDRERRLVVEILTTVLKISNQDFRGLVVFSSPVVNSSTNHSVLSSIEEMSRNNNQAARSSSLDLQQQGPNAIGKDSTRSIKDRFMPGSPSLLDKISSG